MLTVEEEITNLTRLRELLPTEGFTNTFLKVTDQLNDVARKFIATAPFIVVATKSSEGLIDVSPKGDPAGFVEVYDDKTLIIPDRLGNHRVDGFQNILEDPNVAILFIVPGHGDTLRIAGKARIVKDSAINNRLAINGKEPLLAMVVEVQEAFMHCSKSLIRSRLWHQENWPARKTAPTLADWVLATVEREQTLDEVQDDHSSDEQTRLY
ncbi:MSMEG_1061 family FMN-dependent PPOX-type flavoprotein [Sulfitobacter geojensis]|uniref:Pyridoxamine 5'-phosphate oxidase family protein n=1 Tax=Sulfitobacter geojensis TaxID=1342299 RepID=A0AAE2W1F8_9RHOB|nr:MSMEG_1061 family FMN-dependent PPOX-type flavoprotein [Sulfitobacter geojensis]MBM1691157.1 pyridoxamine 5'-phosphate oxidase family protein [Sulfitobacter geojensis]MBM1695223.1 pyridoxamine 5'-phosphate oxidase family protein [Sulfitobacter geojensis]MBM1707323.1 pyridoxamine 5'-phosphate oxidase family protein [Sulfitobacter geojensis]MBM1711473.1 pyridoxamine 5'-phosphate oxidase family protein [Sulfitobacter geojensis]MBM1715448.1 pyridoxamine 5'-phosphate oxidase family protein [Sulf